MPDKPSEAEEEYFARLEFERRKTVAAERERALAAEERRRLRELHHMRCPKCGMELIEVAFRSIRVDRCSSCSGVWLDAGELETVARRESGGLIKGLADLFGGTTAKP